MSIYKIVYSPDNNNSFKVATQYIIAPNEIKAVKRFFNNKKNDYISWNDLKSISLFKKN